MRSRLKVTGMSALRTELRRVEGAVLQSSRRAMHVAAEKIVEKAKEYVPEGTLNLKNSIAIIKDYSGERGQLQIDIGIQPKGDHFSASGTPITHEDIMRYAVIVHENYEGMLKPREVNGKTIGGPGKKTLANPGKVGSGFLRRAAQEEEARLRERLVSAVTQAIGMTK